MKQKFKSWMAKVDAALMKKVGLTHYDLADYCYRDAYDNDDSPTSVARDVLANEGWEE